MRLPRFAQFARRVAKDENGTALVLVTVFIVALLAFASLSVDAGNMYVQRARVQEAIDAASLAAVRSWATGGAGVDVITLGKAFATANGAQTTDITAVEPGYWVNSTKTFVGPLPSLPKPLPTGAIAAVRVRARKTVPMYFGRVIGISAMSPRVEAVAVAAQAKTALRVVPWAICDQDLVNPTHCDPVTLKYTELYNGTNSCSADAGSANFGALALGQSGASTYGNNIEKGYSTPIRVGDCVKTEPGNMSGPTFNSLDKRLQGVPAYDCTVSPPSDPPDNPRLAIAPRVSSLEVNGSKEVCITGFYVIALTDYSKSDGYVNAVYLEDFEGTEIDPNATAQAGRLSAIGLVK